MIINIVGLIRELIGVINIVVQITISMLYCSANVDCKYIMLLGTQHIIFENVIVMICNKISGYFFVTFSFKCLFSDAFRLLNNIEYATRMMTVAPTSAITINQVVTFARETKFVGSTKGVQIAKGITLWMCLISAVIKIAKKNSHNKQAPKTFCYKLFFFVFSF